MPQPPMHLVMAVTGVAVTCWPTPPGVRVVAIPMPHLYCDAGVYPDTRRTMGS